MLVVLSLAPLHDEGMARITSVALVCVLALSACEGDISGSDGGGVDVGRVSSGDANTPSNVDAWSVPLDAANPLINPAEGPPAGNPMGTCAIPAGAGTASIASPRTVVGTGTPESCNGEAFVAAVALGGVITFNCGAAPVTIVTPRVAKVFNDTGPEITIDGGGLVTLSGNHDHRILYMNTCDETQRWTTSHCNDQDHPRLTVQNITFVAGDSRNETEYDGGGAIWSRGGQLRIVNSRFFGNRCVDTGPDVGGGAVRAFDQFEDRPIYVVNSTFGGGPAYSNQGSNGGALSSIGVSWTILNSLLSHNHAIGNGGNPTMPGTPGGGSGGAIYNDGNEMTLTLCGTRIEDNDVVQHGSGIFFVTNNHTGSIRLDRSALRRNTGGSWYAVRPQISCHDDTPIEVTDSVFE